MYFDEAYHGLRTGKYTSIYRTDWGDRCWVLMNHVPNHIPPVYPCMIFSSAPMGIRVFPVWNPQGGDLLHDDWHGTLATQAA